MKFNFFLLLLLNIALVISSSLPSPINPSVHHAQSTRGVSDTLNRVQRRLTTDGHEGKRLTALAIRGKKDVDNIPSLVCESIKAVDVRDIHKKILGWLPDGFKNGVASGLAAAVVKTILQPFDTIKTVQQAKQALKIGPFAAGSQIIKERGIGGLWSGIGITVIGSSPSVAVYFGVYSSCKSRLTAVFPPRFQLFAVALSAMIGNTLASFLRVPYEVIKQRIQAGQFSNTMEAVAYSWKNEGVVGLFGGGKLASQIVRDVPYAIVTLVSYEILQGILTQMSQRALVMLKEETNQKNKKNNSNNNNSNSNNDSNNNGIGIPHSPLGLLGNKKLKDALCGSLAGGLGTLATTPMDVVKTRMMTGTRYTSILDATIKIASEEGLATFFIGTAPRLLHKIPANGLFFLCYESFRTLLGVTVEAR